MTVNLAIGLFHPPFGINIFLLQAMFGTPLRTIYAGILPFLLIDLVALMVVTYVPDLSLTLVRWPNEHQPRSALSSPLVSKSLSRMAPVGDALSSP